VEGAKLLDAAGVKFLPAINEELGATAVLGTQRVESDPERTADGVFAMWYGKGPGVDRAGDALKHGNAYGSSPHGGVLVVAGDDHGCVSSSMPHQSDVAMQSWHMPVVAPASVAEYLEFGLYGWALSRFSGNWVGFTALSEVVESGSTVDLDLTNARVAAWKGGAEVEAETGFVRPADGLHYRWPDLPSLKIEERLHAKLDAVRAFAKVNPLDREIVASPNGDGRHRHLRQGALRPARGVPPPRHLARRARRGGRAALQGGPVLSARADPDRALRRGLSEILVVEEKGAVVETQMRDLFYNAAVRPAIVGKRDAQGRPLVSELGELRPSRLIEIVAAGSRRASRSSTGATWWSTSPCRRCCRTSAIRSSGCPTSAPAARTAPRPACPRARAPRPASAATSWPRG
jgi:indolepyruvate ferredoxin oxidoreductase